MNRGDFLRHAGVAAGGVFGLANLAEAVQAASTPYNRPKLKITDVPCETSANQR